MAKGSCPLGHCQKCGDTNGPWSLVNNKWLCDMCADEEEAKQVSVIGVDDIQNMIEENNNKGE